MVLEILAVVFGAGGAATLGVVFKAWQARKDGFQSARREHIADLAAWREEAHDHARELAELLDYWRNVAASYEYQLRSHGIEPTHSVPTPSVKEEIA
ncbi:hypothetical protein [Kitasatospora sp. McL0602]|uniref:hypothetical protein n=1 Tax=Kitasatospora sp. McL0602 TaxID=3439530 RepID=UPI003F8BA6E0